MAALVSDIGPSGGEYVGLREAVQRFGIAYSTLRGYVHSGQLSAARTPNNRIWLRVTDIEGLFQPYEPKHQHTPED